MRKGMDQMVGVRPSGGPDTFGRAATAVASQILGLTHGVVGKDESAEDAVARVAEAIGSLRSELRQGGERTAQALGERLGFTPNDRVVELLEDFPSEMAKVVSGDVAKWVEASGVVAPFPDVARISVGHGSRDGMPGNPDSLRGVALRSAECDASGHVKFVSDADVDLYLHTKGTRGGRFAKVEEIAEVLPLSERDWDVIGTAMAKRERIARAAPLPDQAVRAAEERRTVEEGRRRLFVAAPEDRGREILAMAEALAEALRGTDEDAARLALASLEGGIHVLRMAEGGGLQPRSLVGEPSHPRP